MSEPLRIKATAPEGSGAGLGTRLTRCGVGSGLFAEVGGRFELHYLAGRDLDFLFCARVDAGTGLFLHYGKCAESDELYLIVVGERLGY